jgi:hypothetical protein
LLVTANVVPSALILSTLMMEVIHSPKTLVITRGMQRHFPGDGIHQQGISWPSVYISRKIP